MLVAGWLVYPWCNIMPVALQCSVAYWCHILAGVDSKVAIEINVCFLLICAGWLLKNVGTKC